MVFINNIFLIDEVRRIEKKTDVKPVQIIFSPNNVEFVNTTDKNSTSKNC